MTEHETFDYVIIGAGSAGCTLAYRLTEDRDVSVLLLEAGGRDWSVYIHMPAAFAEPLKTDTHNWAYMTEPEPWMDGRRMYQPRGRVLGGSSSINGMVYIRGHALDYDRWAEDDGLAEWSYAHVLPYFKKAETREKGADAYHGGDGPLYVHTGDQDNPLFDAFIEAGQQAGYPYTEDLNGEQQEGFGRKDMTVHNGRRWSCAVAYLRPAMRRSNLTVRRRAFTSRLTFEGTRATGVAYNWQGRDREVRAAREVIVCGGAVNSPQLLQLSGIGPADRLKRLDVPVVADLPGVGENLQDHLEVYVQQACTQPISLYPALKFWGRMKVGLQWLLTRSGPGASNNFEAGGFIRSRAGIKHPNLQYHFLPVAVSYDGSAPQDTHGYQAHVGPMRPEARGHVRLRSADPREAPEILFNYMATETDRREMREAVELTREVLAQRAFDPYRGEELNPGKDVKSDDEIDAWVRRNGESAYHPSCTCRMSGREDDESAVLDAECRVRGVENLRVVDASVMPTIVTGNLNAPTIMIAEKAADLIRGRDPLPPEHPPVWIHPEWETKQR